MPEKPKILFSSVFKPFAEDDNLYSRKDSICELHHNQLTRYQGIFSPRFHHNSHGLYAIANNIPVPSVVLDFPTLDRFIREIKKGYDYVGIGSIMANFQKVKRMTEEIRRHSPRSKIVLGGFCTTIEQLDRMLEVDHVCRGEGIAFMRKLLGFEEQFEFRQPNVYYKTVEIMGVPFLWDDYSPAVIVGLGCPYGCDFCCPSHFFGKKHIKFLKTGEQVFAAVMQLYRKFNASTMVFIGDDNFLADEKRAREFHQEVVKSGIQFRFMIFGSADLVAEWEPEQLAEMGVFNLWIGRESKFGPYAKNRKVNLKQIIADLHRVGISVILSSILLMDEHTQANIWEDIEDHLAGNPDFSQFAFYSPTPGTPLYQRLQDQGRLLLNIPLEEWHAFKQPWFTHPEFSLVEAEQIQKKAYQEDFLRLGPSGTRVIATEVEGYRNLKNSPSAQLRGRAEMFRKNFRQYRIVLKASSSLLPNPELKRKNQELLEQLEKADRRVNLLEGIAAWAVVAAGKTRQLRTKYFGDVLQPKTIVTNYSGSPR